jgi:hypothetical protein
MDEIIVSHDPWVRSNDSIWTQKSGPRKFNWTKVWNSHALYFHNVVSANFCFFQPKTFLDYRPNFLHPSPPQKKQKQKTVCFFKFFLTNGSSDKK